MANTANSNAPMLSEQISSATATAGAATCNAQLGVITSEALTTAHNASYTLTLTNSYIGTGSLVLASVGRATATAGLPVVSSVKPAAGSVVIIVNNVDGTNAFDGTIKVNFLVL